MTEPLRTQHTWGPQRGDGRRLLGCLAPAIAGVLVGIVLALIALVALAPPPRGAPPPSTSIPAHATITLDNAFLSQLSADALRQTTLPFALANVRAAIHPGNQIAIAADATAGPFTRELAAAGTLTVADGRLHLHVTQASVGGLALPAALNGALESTLNARLAALNDLLQLGGTSYAITSVTTQEGLLTLGLAPS